jgi:hypothetical protein
MELYRELLVRPRISVVSAESDSELERVARRIAPSVRVGSRAQLCRVLEQLVAASDGGTTGPKSLDLIGHSTRSTSQLRLGDWVIDAARADVTTTFHELAKRRIWSRLGIRAIRLLGCRTASTPQGRLTIRELAAVAAVEVYGTVHLLHGGHYDTEGFCPAWDFLLVGSRDLARDGASTVAEGTVVSRNELFAVGAPAEAGRSRRVVTASAARAILRLVRHDAGAMMPGAPPPVYELVMPSPGVDNCRIAHVLWDGAFVTFCREPAATAGLVYPVDDAAALRWIVETLPVLKGQSPAQRIPW